MTGRLDEVEKGVDSGDGRSETKEGNRQEMSREESPREGGKERRNESSPVVPETRISLDSSLLGKDLIELSLDVAEDLAETAREGRRRSASKGGREGGRSRAEAHQEVLSMRSPNLKSQEGQNFVSYFERAEGTQGW